MRYEHIELDISTAAVSALRMALGLRPWALETPPVRAELDNFINELEARLQRRDADPHSPKNVKDNSDLIG